MLALYIFTLPLPDFDSPCSDWALHPALARSWLRYWLPLKSPEKMNFVLTFILSFCYIRNITLFSNWDRNDLFLCRNIIAYSDLKYGVTNMCPAINLWPLLLSEIVWPTELSIKHLDTRKVLALVQVKTCINMSPHRDLTRNGCTDDFLPWQRTDLNNIPKSWNNFLIMCSQMLVSNLWENC